MARYTEAELLDPSPLASPNTLQPCSGMPSFRPSCEQRATNSSQAQHNPQSVNTPRHPSISPAWNQSTAQQELVAPISLERAAERRHDGRRE